MEPRPKLRCFSATLASRGLGHAGLLNPPRILELLPSRGGEIVTAGQRGRIDRCRNVRINVPEPLADVGQRHARREQERAVCVSRRVWRLAPLGSFRLRNRNETKAETVSGFNGDPSGLQNM
jgi:hypothetical protein